MKSRSTFCVLLLSLMLVPRALYSQKEAAVWLTNPDRSALLEHQSQPLRFARGKASASIIRVDDKQRFQKVDGFGFALTGGSAQLMMKMKPEARAALVHELIATEGGGIGVSYLRVSVGSSDMNERVYTYDDLPAGQTDPTLAHFSLAPDEADVIRVLKEILAINPKIKLLASPWSAPAWMKTNEDVKGGKLRPEYYDAYAEYLVQYIRGMKARGISIEALTVQNEPLNPKNTPSMVMLAPEEDAFIRDHLGPAFHRAGIHTKIVLYDHNCDVPDYPLSILRDPAAARYVDGSGFHLYAGKIEALSQVHDDFPAKSLYFTEQMVVDRPGDSRILIARPTAGIVIGATRNWSRNVLLWNLAADPDFGPHTNNGGCPVCEGAITLDGDNVVRNVAYYTIAHASKFVRPGSRRIASSGPDSLPNVAFRTPGGEKVLIVANSNDSPQSFQVEFHSKEFDATLPAGAVATYVW